MPRLTYAVPLAATLALLTACSLPFGDSGPVEIETAKLGADARSACDAVLDAAPSTFVGLTAREVTPTSATGRAWGSPAVLLTCETSMPEEFTPGASCEEVNGVGWYVPIAQFSDLSQDLTIYTIGREPVVKLRVPADYRDNTAFAADALVTLSDPVKAGIPQAEPCV